MSDDGITINALTVEQLQHTMQDMGYRVTITEFEQQSVLQSATQGLGFSIRPGNKAQAQQSFVDYTLSCALRIAGDVSAALVNDWNGLKRFSRLTHQAPFLVLEMDVVLAGGVTEPHLRAMTELWERLVSELLNYLRTALAPAPATEEVAS